MKRSPGSASLANEGRSGRSRLTPGHTRTLSLHGHRREALCVSHASGLGVPDANARHRNRCSVGDNSGPSPDEIASNSALHLFWDLSSADSVAVESLRGQLAVGQESRLFDISSSECREDEFNVVLVPNAPLEAIVELIWKAGLEPAGIWSVEVPPPPPPTP